jgi:hypothetical protein
MPQPSAPSAYWLTAPQSPAIRFPALLKSPTALLALTVAFDPTLVRQKIMNLSNVWPPNGLTHTASPRAIGTSNADPSLRISAGELGCAILLRGFNPLAAFLHHLDKPR